MKLYDNYDVGIYCRLSRDDGKKGKQESMSIENQKRILTKNVTDRGWNVKEVYVDDGKSGMNFDRLDFNRMVRDLKAKRINCVIVKSLDRLGRGSETGNKIEELFIEPQIRFIALGECIDTADGVDDLMDILHAISGMYPKMVSRKVRQIKKENSQRGMFMNSQAPYGYEKSPQDKHILIPDAYASRIIHRIFTEFDGGDSGRMIADRLNTEGIDSPRFYHYAKAGKENPYPKQKNVWGSATIMQLLRNQVYIGNLVSGKREVASIKTKRVRAIDKEDWIVVEGTHEPIITSELWDRVQKRLEARHRIYETKRTKTIGLFAGLLRCADCDSPLAYMNKKLKSGEKGVYRCSKYNNNGGKACTTHYIDEADLCEFVMNDIRRYAVLSVTERQNLSKLLMASMRKEQNAEASTISAVIRKDESRLLVIASTLKSLYEDKASGELSKEMFQTFMRGYTQEQAEIEGRLPRLRRELDIIKETTGEIDQSYETLSIS